MYTIDIHSDFYSDPQIKLIHKDELKRKIPSKVMWALILNCHPKSKFFELDTTTRQNLIKKDYLNDDKFNFDDYSDVTNKILSNLPNTASRFLFTWNTKLNEINDFLASVQYNENTYEMISKIMKDLHPMMKQYKEIYKEFQTQESTTLGNVEESLSEKGLI